MTWESGAGEPLALEFQPPRAQPCACGFGLAAQKQGFSVIAQGARPRVGSLSSGAQGLRGFPS